MMAAALMSATAFAGEATTDSFTTSSQDFKRFSGALHVGGGTAYTASLALKKGLELINLHDLIKA